VKEAWNALLKQAGLLKDEEQDNKDAAGNAAAADPGSSAVK